MFTGEILDIFLILRINFSNLKPVFKSCFESVTNQATVSKYDDDDHRGYIRSPPPPCSHYRPASQHESLYCSCVPNRSRVCPFPPGFSPFFSFYMYKFNFYKFFNPIYFLICSFINIYRDTCFYLFLSFFFKLFIYDLDNYIYNKLLSFFVLY